MVERIHGKDEVTGSIPVRGSINVSWAHSYSKWDLLTSPIQLKIYHFQKIIF